MDKSGTTSPFPPSVCGVDVSDKRSEVCVLDAAGEVMEQTQIPSSPAGLERYFRRQDPTRVVLEVSTHSPWMSRLLAELGHEVIVANPRRVRLIAQNDDKSDRVDAELLARLGRADPTLLRPIRHRGAKAQQMLSVVRARDALVRARSSLISHVRGSVKAMGSRIPSCSADSFHKRAQEHVPATLAPALQPVVEVIARLSADIHAYDQLMANACDQHYPETASLRQIAGVGPVTALAYVLTLDDPSRFRNGRRVGAYFGFRPRKRQTGESNPELGIRKGDGYMRRLLVGSAHYILGPFGPDCDLRRWGMQLAARGGGTRGAKKRASVAVARKLSGVLYHLWVTGETYEPLRRGAALPSTTTR